MAELDLEADLKRLKQSLREIKTLLAWEQLKLAEARPHQSPAFQINNPIEADLRNEYSFFLSTSVQMHSVLNDTTANITKLKRQKIKIELLKIEHQAYGLNLQQRFLPC